MCNLEINPTQPGCIFDIQCSSVWPRATCDKAGVCQCPNNPTDPVRPETTRPVQTRDGWVCVDSSVNQACPLPASDPFVIAHVAAALTEDSSIITLAAYGRLPSIVECNPDS